MISFVLTIAALVVMLAVFKLHPVIGLFASAILAGLLVKMPLTDLASALSAGFGGTLVALGLVVAFGTILSYYLEKSGAIDELAKWMVRTLGPKNDVLALGIASYIISIPGAIFSVWHNVLGTIIANLMAKKVEQQTEKTEYVDV